MLFKNFLSEVETQKIYDEFMTSTRYPEYHDVVWHKGNASLTEAAENLPTTLACLEKFEQVLTPIFGPLKFTSSFTRLYKNNSYLRAHIDRHRLYVAVSVCLKKDVPWPLNISKKKINFMWTNNIDAKFDRSPWLNDYESYDLDPGDFCVCLGRHYPHWRDKLECQPNQSNVYTFLHWTRI